MKSSEDWRLSETEVEEDCVLPTLPMVKEGSSDWREGAIQLYEEPPPASMKHGVGVQESISVKNQELSCCLKLSLILQQHTPHSIIAGINIRAHQ